jgi:uncharacterized OB-fold protein
MSDYCKFLPEGIPATHMPFWESLKEHAVKVQRCDTCATFRYIPKDICPKCHSDLASWTAISGRGEVYTYTIVRRAPTPAYQEDAPYVLAHVTMDEGFRMAARLTGTDSECVRIGMLVQIAYEDVTPEWTFFIFQPVG